MNQYFKIQLGGWNKNKPFSLLYFMFVSKEGKKEIRSIIAFYMHILSEDYEFIRMSSDAVPEFKYKEIK